MLKRLLSLLPLLFWTSACSVSSIFSLTPTPTLYTPPTAVTPFVPPLTMDSLRNAEFVLPVFGGASYSCQLADGKCAFTDPSAGQIGVSLLDFFAFGDLNADGVDDAAVLIAQDYGGSGIFVSLNAVVNEGGRPRHAASTMVDDRPKINSLAIREGEIVLDAVLHGVDDPACCPEWPVTRSFELRGASLALVHAATRLPNGQERVIVIESPVDGAEARGEVAVAGRVTIAPFEGALVFRVYNEQGNELFVAPIMVDAPGSFTFTLDTGAFPPGRVRIVIADLSPADGSILALDSVEIVVK